MQQLYHCFLSLPWPEIGDLEGKKKRWNARTNNRNTDLSYGASSRFFSSCTKSQALFLVYEDQLSLTHLRAMLPLLGRIQSLFHMVSSYGQHETVVLFYEFVQPWLELFSKLSSLCFTVFSLNNEQCQQSPMNCGEDLFILVRCCWNNTHFWPSIEARLRLSPWLQLCKDFQTLLVLVMKITVLIGWRRYFQLD